MSMTLKTFFSKFSIRSIIYYGLAAMGISIIGVISVFSYTNSTLEGSKIVVNEIIAIEKQNVKILKTIENITSIETDILLANSYEKFDTLDEGTIGEDISLKKLKLGFNKKDVAIYNNSLESLQENIYRHIQLKEDIFEVSYSIFHYKQETSKSLLDIEKEMSVIINLTDSLFGKVNLKIKRENRRLNLALKNGKFNNTMIPSLQSALVGDTHKVKLIINSLHKVILSLATIDTEISLAKNYDEIIDIKTNKLIQIYLLIDKNIVQLRNLLEKDKDLNSIIDNINLSVLKMKEFGDALIIMKELSYFQKQKLEALVISRDELSLDVNTNLDVINQVSINIKKTMTEDFDISSENTLTLIIIIIFIVLGVMFIFGISLISRITKPLNNIVNSIKNISVEKDNLSNNIDVEYSDEYKELTNAFNLMTSSLEKNIKKLERRDLEISTLNRDLEQKVKDRTLSLDKKTKRITTLLNNAKQGFLSFSQDLIIDNEHSQECQRIFGEEVSSKNIVELLFKNSEKREFYKETLKDVLNSEDKVIGQAFLALLPRESKVNKLSISIEYIVLENKTFMLILTDITSKKELETKIKREKKILQMIVSIVSSSAQFFEIKDDFDEFIKKKDEVKDVDELYRVVHTFKGLFSQHYMINTVSSLHELETDIALSLKEAKDSSLVLDTLVQKVFSSNCLDKDLEVIKAILGDKFLEEKTILKIDEKSIIDLEQKVYHYYKIDKRSSKNYEDILAHTQKLRVRSLYQVLSAYPKAVQAVASSLEKEINTFDVIGDKNIELPENFKPFIKSLIHVFRNMVDHGIESPVHRVDIGKESEGNISCSFKIENKELLIEIADDGQGIDTDIIKQRALDKNIFTMEQLDEMDDNEIKFLIFSDGFSTKDEVSKLSGRGVGMAAVKEELNKIKAKVEINSEVMMGTSFIFRLPYQREGNRYEQ